MCEIRYKIEGQWNAGTGCEYLTNFVPLADQLSKKTSNLFAVFARLIILAGQLFI